MEKDGTQATHIAHLKARLVEDHERPGEVVSLQNRQVAVEHCTQRLDLDLVSVCSSGVVEIMDDRSHEEREQLSLAEILVSTDKRQEVVHGEKHVRRMRGAVVRIGAIVELHLAQKRFKHMWLEVAMLVKPMGLKYHGCDDEQSHPPTPAVDLADVHLPIPQPH
eukprot:2408697-Prymnesium_polylepis.3